MRFLTTGQIAASCQVTIPTVKRWIREGHLAAFQTAGGHFRVTEAEFRRFKEAHGIPGAPPGPSGDGLPRVLIADDDPAVLDILSEALSLEGRYTIEVARDGYQALIKVGSFAPDVLVLDIAMPELDGFEVCRRVKADPARRETRVLAISGLQHTRDEILATGADAFLAKPVKPTDLQAEVARLLAPVAR